MSKRLPIAKQTKLGMDRITTEISATTRAERARQARRLIREASRCLARAHEAIRCL